MSIDDQTPITSVEGEAEQTLTAAAATPAGKTATPPTWGATDSSKSSPEQETVVPETVDRQQTVVGSVALPRIGPASQTHRVQIDRSRRHQPGTLQTDEARYDPGPDFARGGLGKIRVAIDKRIQREVAYKELLPKALDDPGLVERFLEEAQITGQLEHPGIVPIYDLGWQDNGTPFYAMKFVRGETFRAAIDALHRLQPDSPERRLRFVQHLRAFVEICNAIAFAHHRGVLHRDLKPHNVMLGQFGETLVLDWGLAKIVGSGAPRNSPPGEPGSGDKSSATSEADVATVLSGSAASAEALRGTLDTDVLNRSQTGALSGATDRPTGRPSVATNVRTDASKTLAGSIMGTPSYMPPEQARGDLNLDARADIYSLGAILYELLTGQPPIVRGPEMHRRILMGVIPLPRTISRTIPPALEAIAMKALSQKREDRYASALDLSADVERYLADEPTSVYREPWWQQARRYVRRHRTAVVSTTVAFGLVLLGILSAWMLESRRIGRLESQARNDLVAVQSALAKDDVNAARATLQNVQGIVQAELALAGLATEIELAGHAIARREAEREAARLAALRRQAEAKLSAATTETDVKQNYASASALLAGVIALLERETALADLRKSAVSQKAAVDRRLQEDRARRIQNERFETFERHVERARFFASNLIRESGQQSAQMVLQAAREALRLYNVDQEMPLVVPAELTKPQADRLREHVHELLVLWSITDRQMARELPGDRREELLRNAHSRLAVAEEVRKAQGLGEAKSTLLLKAVLLSDLGRGDDAAAVQREADAISPRTAADFYLLAQHEQNVNRRFPEAIVLYQRALTQEPDHFLALYALGICNLQQLEELDRQGRLDAEATGYLSAAAAAFSSCLALRPDFPWSYVMRGVAYSSLKRVEEGFADFDRARQLQDSPGVYDAESFRFALHMNQGIVLLHMDRLDEAESHFLEAARARNDSTSQPISMAQLLARREQFREALDQLTLAAQRDPQLAVAHRLQADVYTSLNARDPRQYPDQLAIEAFEEAISCETSPALKAADLFDLGRVHFRAKRWEMALNAFDASLKLAPRSEDVHRLRGEVLLELKQLPQAIEAFTEYLKLAKAPQADAYRARGLAHAALGNYREATRDYTRSLELEPGSAHIHTRLGWAHLLKGYELAEQEFDAAIRENPENGDSWNGRGFARVKQGRHAEGVADAEKAVKAGPEVWSTYFNAAGVFAQALPVVSRDQKLSADQQTALRQRYTARALELLNHAATLASRSEFIANLNADEALDPLRESAEFQNLLD